MRAHRREIRPDPADEVRTDRRRADSHERAGDDEKTPRRTRSVDAKEVDANRRHIADVTTALVMPCSALRFRWERRGVVVFRLCMGQLERRDTVSPKAFATLARMVASDAVTGPLVRDALRPWIVRCVERMLVPLSSDDDDVWDDLSAEGRVFWERIEDAVLPLSLEFLEIALDRHATGTRRRDLFTRYLAEATSPIVWLSAIVVARTRRLGTLPSTLTPAPSSRRGRETPLHRGSRQREANAFRGQGWRAAPPNRRRSRPAMLTTQSA